MTDIRQLDGDPHDVAKAAGEVATSHLDAAFDALQDFRWAARGAWMTAEHHRTGDMPKGETFNDSALGRKIEDQVENLAGMRAHQQRLTAAAGWNPKSQ